MISIERDSDEPYTWHTGEAPLDQVANVEKEMPDEYISEDGFHITQSCRDYLSGLIQGESYPPYKNGLPQYVELKKVLAEKKTGTTFTV